MTSPHQARSWPRTPQRPAPPAPEALVSTRLEGTGVLFVGFLLLLADTYLGISSEVGVLRVVHAATLLAWGLFGMVVFKAGSRPFREYRQNVLLAAFVAFTALTIPLAYVKSYALEAFRTQFDYFGLFVLAAYLVDRPSRARNVALTAGAIIVALVVRNLDKLTSSVRESGFRASTTFMGDGNDFAWGLTVLFPLALFLVVGRHRWPLRLFGLVAVATAIVGIVGTQSRGATIAVAASGVVFIAMVAKRKALAIGMAAAMLAFGLAFAPTEYSARMQTISSFEEDNSALGRLQAWNAAISMALDHPLGVGADNFNSAYGRVYLRRQTSTRLSWGQDRWISPHSIYFRALAEYGFLGGFLLLTIVGTNLVDSIRARRRPHLEPRSRNAIDPLPGIVAMAIVGHAVGGVFLGGLTYPHLHLLSGMTVAVRRGLALDRDEADERRPSTARSASISQLRRKSSPAVKSAAVADSGREATTSWRR